MKKLVPFLFALAGVAFLLPAVKSLIKGEPVRGVFIVFSMMFLTFAIVSYAGVRKESGGAPGPPSP